MKIKITVEDKPGSKTTISSYIGSDKERLCKILKSSEALCMALFENNKPLAETTHKPLVETTHKPLVETTHKPLTETTHKPLVETTHKPLVETTHKPLTETTQMKKKTYYTECECGSTMVVRNYENGKSKCYKCNKEYTYDGYIGANVRCPNCNAMWVFMANKSKIPSNYRCSACSSIVDLVLNEKRNIIVSL